MFKFVSKACFLIRWGCFSFDTKWYASGMVDGCVCFNQSKGLRYFPTPFDLIWTGQEAFTLLIEILRLTFRVNFGTQRKCLLLIKHVYFEVEIAAIDEALYVKDYILLHYVVQLFFCNFIRPIAHVISVLH